MRKLIADPRASASGHKQTLKRLHLMSALPPKADIAYGDARFESLESFRCDYFRAAVCSRCAGGSRSNSIISSTPITAKPITMKPSIYASTLAWICTAWASSAVARASASGRRPTDADGLGIILQPLVGGNEPVATCSPIRFE